MYYKKPAWWYIARQCMRDYKANIKLIKEYIDEEAEKMDAPEDIKINTGKLNENGEKIYTTTKQYTHGSGTTDKVFFAIERLERNKHYQLLKAKVAAIDMAIYITERMPKGTKRIQLIDLVYNRGKKISQCVIDITKTSEDTLGRWHSSFLRLIAEELGEVQKR